MKRHTEIGDSLCAPLQSLRHVRPIIRSHHERLDGSGYPDGLRGDEVPLLAQIVGIIDVYDALTSARPYRPALTSGTAIRHLMLQVEQRKFSRGLSRRSSTRWTKSRRRLNCLKSQPAAEEDRRNHAARSEEPGAYGHNFRDAAAQVSRRACASRGGDPGAAYRAG